VAWLHRNHGTRRSFSVSFFVIPAQAGIQFFLFSVSLSFPRKRESILFLFCFFVIPAQAGMTEKTKQKQQNRNRKNMGGTPTLRC